MFNIATGLAQAHLKIFKPFCIYPRIVFRPGVQSAQKCRVGFPVPNYDESKFGESDQDGMKYNCYSYEKVSDYYLPRLREAMKNRQERYENRKAAES